MGPKSIQYKKLNDIILLVQTIRVSEESNGNEMVTFGQLLVKGVHSSPDGDTEPRKKKRKTGGDSDVEDIEVVALEFVDE